MDTVSVYRSELSAPGETVELDVRRRKSLTFLEPMLTEDGGVSPEATESAQGD